MVISEGKIECPVCLGWGELDAPKPDKQMSDKVKAAKALKKAGFSFREIMKLMDYKSPRSVSYLLEKGNKKVI